MVHASDPYFGRLLKSAPHLAEKLIGELAHSEDSLLATTVWNEAQVPWQTLEPLIKLNPEINISHAVQHPNASKAFVLQALHSSGEHWHRSLAAQSVAISFDELTPFLADNDLGWAIASRPDVEPDFLRRLLDEHPANVRSCSAVAASSRLTTDLARRVAQVSVELAPEDAERVNRQLFMNPACPDEIRAAIVLMTGPVHETVDSSLAPWLVSWLYFMLPEASRDVMDALVMLGHPAGLLYEFHDSVTVPEDEGVSLCNMLQYEMVQRALWPALLTRPDASLSYVPSELDPEALLLHVGELEGRGDTYGVEHNFALAWGALGYALLPRPWVEIGLLPTDFSFSADAFEEFFGATGVDAAYLARLACAAAFSSGGFLTHTADSTIALTETGVDALRDLPTFYDEFYPARITWAHVPPFTWSALSADRKRAFLRYVCAAANSEVSLVREAGLKVLGYLAAIPPSTVNDLTSEDKDVLRAFADEELEEVLGLEMPDAGSLDASTLGSTGHLLKRNGHAAAARQTLMAATQLGHVSAAATLSWWALEVDECASLIGELESALPLIETDWGERWPSGVQNVRSNLALCRLRLGGPASEALRVWEEGSGVGHRESLLYPAVIALRNGDTAAAATVVGSLSDEDRQFLAEELRAETAVAQGWFLDWCRDGLLTLKLISPSN